MADQGYVRRVGNDAISLVILGESTLFSRAEALELFKQLSKELGFTTPSFTCLYKHLGHCTGPTVLECWDGDPEHEGYDYICEGHQDRYRKKHQSPDLFIRDMRDIPKEKA